jgi:RNA polymerase sigma-70 factor (ECF subfamily)
MTRGIADAHTQSHAGSGGRGGPTRRPREARVVTPRAGPCAGDRRRVFEAEVDRLMDRLYGTALRLARNRADAEDAVADALVKAWAGFDGLQDLQSFEKWIFRILVNTFISEQRRRRSRPVEERIDGDEELDRFSLFETVHQPFLLWWSNPEQQLLDRLLREDIEHALEALPEEFRVVVIMVEVSGFSYAEAAATLEIPIGTVRSRLSRGRAALQRALWRQASQLGIAVADVHGVVR